MEIRLCPRGTLERPSAFRSGPVSSAASSLGYGAPSAPGAAAAPAGLLAIPHGTALVFEAPNGGPIRRSNWHRRVWVPIRKAAGLDSLRYHDLRHAAASALLGAGIDVATTAAILGHSSPAVTLRVYSHSIPSRQREAAAKLDALYSVAADA